MSVASDVNTQSWFLKNLPPFIEPYVRLLRLDRFVPYWLVLLPCWWAIFLASYPVFPNIKFLLISAVGALLMRSAGCIGNDLTDQKFDGQVKRTLLRPLVDGSLTRKQAYSALGLLLACGLVLLTQLDDMTIILGVVAVIMTMTYPWMKRITYWPQAFLGLTWNIGVLMGWTMVRHELEWTTVILYCASFFLTVYFDTFYAHQDKEDDYRIGVKSNALALQSNTLPFLLICVTCFAIFMTITGMVLCMHSLYYLAAFMASAFMFLQCFKVDYDNPDECLNAFKQTRWISWVILAGIFGEWIITINFYQ